jgi:hypothetical protein
MFSALSRAFTNFLYGRPMEEAFTISHGNCRLIELIRQNYKIISEASDEAGVMIRVSGTKRELEKLKSLVGEK